MVNTWASYNMIIGPLALNRVRAVMSTLHLCMKYLVGKGVGFVKADKKIVCRYYEDNLKIGCRPTGYVGANNNRAFVNFLDLDPRQQLED
ncbi:hypothetical protein CR513_51517, partial [Mucuna pruriens]